MPSRAMISDCRLHLMREFELPRLLVVPVGGLAIEELLGKPPEAGRSAAMG